MENYMNDYLDPMNSAVNDTGFDRSIVTIATALPGNRLLNKTRENWTNILDRNHGLNQLWFLTLDRGKNAYTIQNLENFNYLTAMAEWSNNFNDDVHSITTTNNRSYWLLPRAPAGGHNIRNWGIGGGVGGFLPQQLDVHGNNPASGSWVGIWDFNGATNQRWILTPSIPDFNNKIVNMITRLNGTSSAGVSSQEAIFNRVHLWASTAGSQHEWRFIRDPNTTDTYMIQSMLERLSGMYLTEGGNRELNFGHDIRPSARWKVVPTTGGFEIINEQSGHVLDVADNGTANGTVISTWSSNNGRNQKWRLNVIA